MLELNEVFDTNAMISNDRLDVRTITMGISLLDCCDSDLDRLCDRIYNKIVDNAQTVKSM